MDRITLDREVFKALASDTRLDILKALDARQKTVTELAKELELNKATVFEHLEKLASVDLIQKLEDDRKWVYWQLTWKGRRLLHPETITLALVLSAALGTLLTAVAAGWIWLSSNIAPIVEGEGGPGIMSSPKEDASARSFAPPTADAPTDAAVQHDPTWLIAAIVLGILCLALIGTAVLLRRKWRAATPGAQAAEA